MHCKVNLLVSMAGEFIKVPNRFQYYSLPGAKAFSNGYRPFLIFLYSLRYYPLRVYKVTYEVTFNFRLYVIPSGVYYSLRLQLIIWFIVIYVRLKRLPLFFLFLLLCNYIRLVPVSPRVSQFGEYCKNITRRPVTFRQPLGGEGVQGFSPSRGGYTKRCLYLCQLCRGL